MEEEKQEKQSKCYKCGKILTKRNAPLDWNEDFLGECYKCLKKSPTHPRWTRLKNLPDFEIDNYYYEPLQINLKTIKK